MLKDSSYDLYQDKNSKGKINKESTRNQKAIFWLKKNVDLSLQGQEYSLLELAGIPIRPPNDLQVETTEKLVENFLKCPWSGKESALNLDENTFYLGILSPNVGRVVVRDLLKVKAGQLKENLCRYFEALELVNAWGQKMRPYTIGELLEPLYGADVNIAKKLIRTAYLGEKPPFSIFQAAVRRIRALGARDGGLEQSGQEQKKKSKIEPLEVWQRLCTIIKFYLTYGKEESKEMESLYEKEDAAYQAGRLLAVLERIQRRAATGKLSSTIVERYYGAASTAPLTVFPLLINMATKAHMPKIRKNNRGYTDLEGLMEEILTKIDEAGGFPRTLNLGQQGEFALGFYHQRADLNARYINKKDVKEDGTNDTLP